MIRELARERSPEVEATILGIEGYQRTPLHVDFSENKHLVDEGFEPVKELTYPDRCKDETFNAVGSMVVGTKKHLPVLDLDHGFINIPRKGAGFVIQCRGRSRLDPASVLKDVIRDNDLGDIELFDGNSISSGRMGTYGLSPFVSAMRWRPKHESDFVVAPSTSSDGVHLYIQHLITAPDYKALIAEMCSIGAIDEGWKRIVKESKGGVLRTPWTEKSQFHRVS